MDMSGKYTLCFEVARTPEIGLQELENTESAINFDNDSCSGNGSTDLRLLQPARLHLSFLAKPDPYFHIFPVYLGLTLFFHFPSFSKSKARLKMLKVCNDLP